MVRLKCMDVSKAGSFLPASPVYGLTGRERFVWGECLFARDLFDAWC